MDAVEDAEPTVTPGAVVVARLVIVKTLEPDGDVSIYARHTPADAALSDLLGMLSFTEHMLAMAQMQGRDALDD